MEKMTTPQDMEPEIQRGFVYRAFQKLFAWGVFATALMLIGGTLFLVGLLIYRGILWAWPW